MRALANALPLCGSLSDGSIDTGAWFANPAPFTMEYIQ